MATQAVMNFDYGLDMFDDMRAIVRTYAQQPQRGAA